MANVGNSVQKKRARLSIDLEGYPDVKAMLERAEHDRAGVSRTFFVIESLRRYLTEQGYARRRDMAAKRESSTVVASS